MWPPWIETLTNISHLLTVFNSSVNFYIYFAKHYQSILGRQGSADRTDTVRLTTMSSYQNNVSRHNSHVLTSTTTTNRTATVTAANQHEEAREDSKMLVNAIVNHSTQKNGDLVNLV